jgi:hypothetical protein
MVKLTFPPKPPHGAPCNGCGQCCQTSLCHLGQFVFIRRDGPCSALEQDGDRYRCGLVVNPRRYAEHLPIGRAATDAALSEAAAVLIGADFACDSRLEGEAKAEGWDQLLAERRRVNRDRMQAARRVWGYDRWPPDVSERLRHAAAARAAGRLMASTRSRAGR